jgi:hypothetical protein
MQEFIKGMISEIYVMEMRALEVVAKESTFGGQIKKSLKEPKLTLELRKKAEELKTFVGEIRENPEKFITITQKIESRRQMKRDTDAFGKKIL